MLPDRLVQFVLVHQAVLTALTIDLRFAPIVGVLGNRTRAEHASTWEVLAFTYRKRRKQEGGPSELF